MTYLSFHQADAFGHLSGLFGVGSKGCPVSVAQKRVLDVSLES